MKRNNNTWFINENVGGHTRTKQYWGACEYVTESDGSSTSSLWRTCLNNPLRFIDPSGWLAGGGGSGGSLPHIIIGGQTNYILPEITIRPDDNPSLSNPHEKPNYPMHYYGSSPTDLPAWGDPSNGPSIGWSNGTGCGGGSGRTGNNVNNTSIRYVLSDYFQKYRHYTQTSLRDCKIAVARSYYQYFSGIDKGESYFSTMANGMILVDRNTYLSEFYEECGLIVKDGMGVDIIEIGQELELGHPYSIILKGEHASGITDVDHVVTMIGIQKKGTTPLLIYINDPIYNDVQVYQWVLFRDDIKDAYFITGLKTP